ncbi:hypothetical protein [Marinilactibacillus psychrotolerans]|uniref:Uncharacterized protein n=1 Tax=Marinilactibacillus psychrotolerans 42ea TaxID=1255609 RepID=A0A1R4JTQ8_9LACT|nr:hypothetical protein FM115_06835 [Marinilactibacillus psychrotolerans 42ea]
MENVENQLKREGKNSKISNLILVCNEFTGLKEILIKECFQNAKHGTGY